jgi:hypothetical protein
MFKKLFGSADKGPAVKPPSASSANTTINAIQDMGDKEESLEKRKELLEKRIDAELQKAREYNKAGKKQQALMCLKVGGGEVVWAAQVKEGQRLAWAPGAVAPLARNTRAVTRRMSVRRKVGGTQRGGGCPKGLSHARCMGTSCSPPWPRHSPSRPHGTAPCLFVTRAEEEASGAGGGQPGEHDHAPH